MSKGITQRGTGAEERNGEQLLGLSHPLVSIFLMGSSFTSNCTYLQQLAAASGFLCRFIPERLTLFLSLPIMFFHATITYDILSGKCAPIGKI
jgi:hypothetical protein